MSTFTLFPRLPAEIQLRVWEISVPYTSAILPQPPISGLTVCRDSRAAYLKSYSRFFKPIAHSMFEYPISLYANLAVENTLYLDNKTILEKAFDDWIEPGLKDTIKHLAVEDDFWRRHRPTTEPQWVDLRYNIFHPGTGIERIRVFNVVLTSTEYTSGGQGGTENRDKAGYMDKKLATCEATFPEDSLVEKEVQDLFSTLENLHQLNFFDSWVEPELRLARFVYD